MEVEVAVVDKKFPFDLWRKFKSMFTFIMDEEAESLDEHAKIMREVLSKMGEQEGVFSPFVSIKSNAFSVDYYKGIYLRHISFLYMYLRNLTFYVLTIKI